MLGGNLQWTDIPFGEGGDVKPKPKDEKENNTSS